MPTPAERRALLAALAEIERGVAREAGGYLRNPVREAGITCEVCLTPLDPDEGAVKCLVCLGHSSAWSPSLADQIGFITYAGLNEQSARLMYAYKVRDPAPEHPRMVRMLLAPALRRHIGCPGVLQGQPISNWCSVPSLSQDRTPAEHPLHRVVESLATRPAVRLAARETLAPARARTVAGDHFTIDEDLSGQHVLLVDDTWVSGGHAQAASMTLRAAGAAAVSVLVIARWLNPKYPATRRLWEERFSVAGYAADQCPWTNGPCPVAPQPSLR